MRPALTALLALLGLGLGGTASPLPRNETPSSSTLSSPRIFSVTGTHGAVSTEVDICSSIGATTLTQGGSAVDAIISAALCVGSTAAFHSGIGGGGFAVLRDVATDPNAGKKQGGGGRMRMLDFRETMPSRGSERMYVDNPDPMASLVGGLAVGVPGELKAWKTLHTRYGKLPWDRLFRPAIELNRGGFRVYDQLAQALNNESYPFLCTEELWSEAYCPGGELKKLGDTVRRTRYADALEQIAHQGIDAFYRGELASGIVEATSQRNGILSLDDLEQYEPVWRHTNNITFADGQYRVYASSAPSSGSAVLSALQTIDTYGTAPVGRNLTTHRLIEATKFAYGERTQYGDPAFVPNTTALEHRFLTREHAQLNRAKISDTSVNPNASYYNPSDAPILSDSGTSQLSVVDKHGLSVTLTTTINTFWGSQVMTRHGIILNNEMDDFSSPSSSSNFFGLAPSQANLIRPGKRPLSSISPVIVEDANTGRLVLATGSAGGSRIITAVIQLVFGVLHYGENLQDAIRQPRWHHQLSPDQASFEWDDPRIPNFQGFDNRTVAYLHELGHNVTWVAPGSSTPQGVQLFKNGTLLAATEVRQLDAKGAAF